MSLDTHIFWQQHFFVNKLYSNIPYVFFWTIYLFVTNNDDDVSLEHLYPYFIFITEKNILDKSRIILAFSIIYSLHHFILMIEKISQTLIIRKNRNIRVTRIFDMHINTNLQLNLLPCTYMQINNVLATAFYTNSTQKLYKYLNNCGSLKNIVNNKMLCGLSLSENQ